MSANLTEEELELLTEEERAGLGLEDGEAEDDGDEEGDGEGEGDEEGEGDGEADEEGDGEGDADDDQGDGQDDDQGEGDGDGDDAGTPPARPAVPPMFKADVPADLDDKLRELDLRAAALDEQLDDGELTASEYRKALSDLSEERDALRWQARKAELAAEAQAQAEENQWLADARTFIDSHPDVRGNKLLFQSFDTVVREVTSDPDNASLTNQQQLEKAYKQWNEALGRTPPAAAGGEQSQQSKAKKDRPAPPPTLAHVPSAASTDTSDGRFAHLDRLAESDPMKFEEALERLSQADRDAYLAAP